MPSSRNYFLNEHHELSRIERSSGGGQPKLGPANWAARGKRIFLSIGRVRSSFATSIDPSARTRHFIVITPEKSVVRRSKVIKKAPDGTYEEPVDYAGPHARTLARLGADILAVMPSGEALVHILPSDLDRIEQLSQRLELLGETEQNRWAPIRAFDTAKLEHRTDTAWLDSMLDDSPTESIIRLQPLLSRGETELVTRAIISRMQLSVSQPINHGTDYSGRHWLAAKISRSTIESIGENFQSIQSIHEPLRSQLSAPAHHGKKKEAFARNTAPPIPTPIDQLPIVGVVDGGIPLNNPMISAFRAGQVQTDGCSDLALGEHGTLVASRVVFGDISVPPWISPGSGSPHRCRFVDINTAFSSDEINEDAVVIGISNCASSYPETRVYNLSFSCHAPLSDSRAARRRERLAMVQDLDNLAAARDLVVVVAAGNSNPGRPPQHRYPDNHRDPHWEIGHWASSYNSLTCGSFVAPPSLTGTGGLSRQHGAPSPFCKVGPGLNKVPVPDLSASGGDISNAYTASNSLGVLCCNSSGQWEDHSGTSFAAPVLAREAARTIDILKGICGENNLPFAGTVKAYLYLIAQPTATPSHYQELARRTLGRGLPSADLLLRPLPTSAVFIWQGTLESNRDTIRVQLPIPRQWLFSSSQPRLEVSTSWNTPCNSATEHLYSCRHVNTRLRTTPDTRAELPKRSRPSIPTGYPLHVREYDLSKTLARMTVDQRQSLPDCWILEVSYTDSNRAPYPSTQAFAPDQRVGMAIRLSDGDPRGASPGSAIELLPMYEHMNRLGGSLPRISTPISIRRRR